MYLSRSRERFDKGKKRKWKQSIKQCSPRKPKHSNKLPHVAHINAITFQQKSFPKIKFQFLYCSAAKFTSSVSVDLQKSLYKYTHTYISPCKLFQNVTPQTFSLQPQQWRLLLLLLLSNANASLSTTPSPFSFSFSFFFLGFALQLAREKPWHLGPIPISKRISITRQASDMSARPSAFSPEAFRFLLPALPTGTTLYSTLFLPIEISYFFLLLFPLWKSTFFFSFLFLEYTQITPFI